MASSYNYTNTPFDLAAGAAGGQPGLPPLGGAGGNMTPPPNPYGTGGPPQGWEIDPTRRGGVRPYDPTGINNTAGGGFYRPTNWQEYMPGGSLYPGNKTPQTPGIGLPSVPGIGLPTDPKQQTKGGLQPLPPLPGYQTNSANPTAGGTPDLGTQTPYVAPPPPIGTPTAGATAQPYYNNSTGDEIGQYYGVQLGPGQVGFTDHPASDPATPPPAGTTPGTGTANTPGGAAAATSGNPYGDHINEASPLGQAARRWEQTQRMGTREQQIAANTPVSNDAWNNGMSITSPQDWQNFRFEDTPQSSQWMRNANMIDNPIDRLRYAFGADTGGATGHNETKMAMIKAGIDPQVAARLADVFMGSAEGETYAPGLGLSGNWRNQQQNMFQIGNQLWGIKNGQRYLVKDFGGNNWESGHQIDINRAGGTAWTPGTQGATGNAALMDWYRQYEKDNPSQFFRNSNQSNPAYIAKGYNQ